MGLFEELYYMEGYRYDQTFTLYFCIKSVMNAAIAAVAFMLLKSIPSKIFNILSKICLFISLISIFSIPSILSGFHVISVLQARIFTYIGVIPLSFWYVSTFIPPKKLKVDDEAQVAPLLPSMQIVIRKNRFKLIPLIAASLFLPFILPILTQDTCITFFNTMPGGFEVAFETVMSTRFTRSLYMNDICPPGPPCHVYATLPEDGSTSAFINVHTSTEVNNIKIRYEIKSQYETNHKLTKESNNSFAIDLDEWDPVGRRTVHTVLLSNLQPETEYYYEIVYHGKTQYYGNYKTFPSKDSNTQIKMAVGGDVSSTPIAFEMTANLINQNPDVFIIGGDSAYDNAMQGCWYCWDTFFQIFEDYNKVANRTIPIIIAIGNHDAGFNANADAKVNTEKYPLYFYYMPQHLRTNKNGETVNQVPELFERRSYFYHLLGKTAFFSLDSKFLENYNGTQEHWIDTKASDLKDFAKFSIYHVPMYPAVVRLVDNPEWIMNLSKDTWTPLFESHRFVGAFENHNHGYKITKPLKEGKVSLEDGVTYFGDGSWGVPTRKLTNENDKNLFEVMGEGNHVWMLKNHDSELELYPVDINGTQFYKSTFRKI